MSGPSCGYLYEAALPGSPAELFVVLTEDAWNQCMTDSVVVPVYRVEEATLNIFNVQVAPDLVARCTRVQNLPHKFLGPQLGRCDTEPWDRIRIGIRKFLDLDARIAEEERAAVPTERTDWWPGQNEIHFAPLPGVAQDKLFAVISDDAWNSRPGASYCATVRLTSKTKPGRKRWEVPVSGGWIVSGDLYSTAYARLEEKSPDPAKYPTELTSSESGQLADRQKTTLTLK